MTVKPFICNNNNNQEILYFNSLFSKYDKLKEPVSFNEIKEKVKLKEYNNEELNSNNLLVLLSIYKEKVLSFQITSLEKNNDKTIGKIDLIETHPKYQKLGIATELVNNSIEILRKNNIEKTLFICSNETVDFWLSRNAKIVDTHKSSSYFTVYNMEMTVDKFKQKRISNKDF